MFVTSDSINRSAIEDLYGYLYQDRDLNNHVTVIGHMTTSSLTDNDAAYCIRTVPNGNAWVGTRTQSVRMVNSK